MDSSSHSVENRIGPVGNRVESVGISGQSDGELDGIGGDSEGFSGESIDCTGAHGAESGKQDVDLSTEPTYTYVQGSIFQAQGSVQETIQDPRNEDVKEDIQDTHQNVHYRHEESVGGPTEGEAHEESDEGPTQGSDEKEDIQDTHPHEGSVIHASGEGRAQGSVYIQDEENVYTQCESSGTNPVEVMAKGRASVLKGVIQESDWRFEAALGSQDTLAISIDRLTRVLDKLLEDTPMPFLAQDSARVHGLRKRVLSLSSTLQIVRIRMKNIESLLHQASRSNSTSPKARERSNHVDSTSKNIQKGV